MVFVGVTHLWKRTCVWKRTSLLSSQLLLSEESAKCAGLVKHLAMSLRIYQRPKNDCQQDCIKGEKPERIRFHSILQA
jgi:hypothetical protein